MTKSKPLPPLEELQKFFRYDEETGVLYRIYAPKNTYLLGKPVGSTNSKGYLHVELNRKKYLVHRIVWCMITGEDPGDSLIDHIDRCRTNNKFSNLRKATKSQNGFNGNHKGYSFHKGRGKYEARIRHEGKNVHIGLFSTAEEARAAYCEKAKELQGEFAPSYDRDVRGV